MEKKKPLARSPAVSSISSAWQALDDNKHLSDLQSVGIGDIVGRSQSSNGRPIADCNAGERVAGSNRVAKISQRRDRDRLPRHEGRRVISGWTGDARHRVEVAAELGQGEVPSGLVSLSRGRE